MSSARNLLASALIGALALSVPLASQAQEDPPGDRPALGSSSGRGGRIDDARGYGVLRHPIHAHGGLVVTQSRPASEVGAAILRRGGNAVDAAVAVAFAEAVTLPRAGNIGGGGYALIYLAKERRTVAIDYYAQGPAALTPDFWNGPDGKPDRKRAISYHGVATPGTVAGLWLAHQHYGKLPWKDVVQPAIDLAEKGVRLSDDEAMILKWGKRTLAKDAVAKTLFYKPDGATYEAGEILRQPQLAWTLREIAKGGADAFYKGEVAKRIVAGVQAGGGLITLQDLAGYKAIESEPVWSTYRGVKLALVQPSSGGVTLAEILNIAETFPLADYGSAGADSTHVIAEATRIALADRNAFVGGFPQVKTPTSGLISKAFAAERAKLITPDAIIPSDKLKAGDPYQHDGKDTTHFSIVDAEGNIVSNTYTLGANFGASVAPAGTGLLLNDSLTNFNWEDRNSAGAPAGGKRVTSPITPFIAFKDDKPWLVAGTPGGGYIISALAQFLINVVDFKLNIAEATERPRINAGVDGGLFYEQAFSPDTLKLLAAKGYKLRPEVTQTSIQSIEIRDGQLYGSADLRRPDSAAVSVQP